jgi:hypothetical protein
MNFLKSQLFVVVLSLLACSSQNSTENIPLNSDNSLTPISVFENAFKNGTSNIQVLQIGSIISILKDDTVGDLHQRFIVKLSNAQTLLIAHNIDLSPRIPNLIIGKSVKFYGEYEWNSEGGVVHWTHKDPGGTHVNGWIEYQGTKYE